MILTCPFSFNRIDFLTVNTFDRFNRSVNLYCIVLLSILSFSFQLPVIMSYRPPFYYGQPGQQHPATTPPQPSQQTVVPPGFITETVTTPGTHMPWHTSVQYRGPQSIATGPTVQTQLQTVQAQPTAQSLISGRNVWPSTPTASHRTEGTTPITPTTQSISSPNLQSATPPPSIKTEQGEEMVYLAIPKGEMNRKEVRSLLGENVEEGNCESDVRDIRDVRESKTVKMEPATTTQVATGNEESVDGAASVDLATGQLPVLDPSIVPKGEGLVDG